MNDSCAWPINRDTVKQYDANHFNSHDDDHFEMKLLFLNISSNELQENPKSNAPLACIQWRIQRTLCVSVRNTEHRHKLCVKINPFAQFLDPTQQPSSQPFVGCEREAASPSGAGAKKIMTLANTMVAAKK